MLPEWPDGTVCVLATGGGAPHAIPVSTAIRTGLDTVHLALGLGRESLARLRADPRCALTVHAPGVTMTVHGHASVVGEDERIAYVRLDVEDVQDHGQPTFEIDDGVRWHWTDDDARAADAGVRAKLREL